MFIFEKLLLSNFLLWEEQEFNFEPGVTFIHGSNGTGKSLLFSSLLPLMYDESYLPKGGRSSLQFHNQQHDYDFTVFNHGKKTNRYEISIDGKEQKTERIADARRIIDKHWSNNIQESLFTTTVSLSGLNRHPLSTGKPASRLEWLNETLAYASILDSYIDDVNKQIKTAREDSVKYSVISDQLTKLDKPELPSRKPSDIKTELDSILEEIKSLEELKHKLTYAQNNKSRIKNTVAKPKHSLKEYKNKFENLATKLDKAISKLNKYESVEKQVESYNKSKDKLNALKTTYKELCDSYKVKVVSPQDNIKKLAKKIREIQETIENNKKVQEQYEEQESLRKFLNKYKNKDVPYTEKEITKKIEKITKEIYLNKLIVKSHKSGDEHCSVCGSSLKNHHKNYKEVEKDIVDQEKQLSKLELQQKLIKARKITLIDVSGLNLETNSKVLKQYKEIIFVAEKYINFKEQFDESSLSKEDLELTRLNKKKLKEVVSNIGVLHTKAQKQYIDAKIYYNTQKELQNIEVNEYFDKTEEQLDTLLEKNFKKLSKLYSKQQELNTELIQAETSIALFKKYKKEKQELLSNKEEYKAANTDFRILNILKKALGRDGFRTKRLESTIELFVDNLNDLAPLLWKEPFKFEVEIGSRKCNLIVHRKGKAGDSLNLSGSEQRRYQLLAGLAMLRLLPDNRRCNTIILDELEANLNEYYRHMMMKDFIPELLKTVPNVIIISPLTLKEIQLSPDRMYTVVCKNNRSKLK